ncbi:MAG: hypothetical protein EBR82_82070 [Caulobacteraceae bacterium]|nr:hypothetical protein [Caulobacteraceae bacterium]
MKHVGAMAKMQGIAPGKIMKDMANNTGEMARAGSRGAEAFGKSAIEIHKMGMEMQTASKIADGLLDFESSINAQNEASVLLGKEINLDKARELALNNDIEGMSREILKNIGSSAEFGKMNRLQQDALAKSVGMTVEELAKTLDAQEESNKYFGEGAGIGMNALGYLTEYGSKAAGFFKENGLLILSTLQFMSQFNILTKAGNVLLAIKNIGGSSCVRICKSCTRVYVCIMGSNWHGHCSDVGFSRSVSFGRSNHDEWCRSRSYSSRCCSNAYHSSSFVCFRKSNSRDCKRIRIICSITITVSTNGSTISCYCRFTSSNGIWSDGTRISFIHSISRSNVT